MIKSILAGRVDVRPMVIVLSKMTPTFRAECDGRITSDPILRDAKAGGDDVGNEEPEVPFFLY